MSSRTVSSRVLVATLVNKACAWRWCQKTLIRAWSDLGRISPNHYSRRSCMRNEWYWRLWCQLTFKIDISHQWSKISTHLISSVLNGQVSRPHGKTGGTAATRSLSLVKPRCLKSDTNSVDQPFNCRAWFAWLSGVTNILVLVEMISRTVPMWVMIRGGYYVSNSSATSSIMIWTNSSTLKFKVGAPSGVWVDWRCRLGQ